MIAVNWPRPVIGSSSAKKASEGIVYRIPVVAVNPGCRNLRRCER